MSNELAKTDNSLKSVLSKESTKEKFKELLGAKAAGFMSSILQLTNNNKLLANADPTTILTAAATAAILDLPINSNFGYAYIVPYKISTPDGYQNVAQFQLGWKGLVQLALRSNQYLRINAIPVYENQFQSFNTLTEDLSANMNIDGDGAVAGYAAYFKLVNGFEKTVFWSTEKVKKHAKKYSKSYGKNSPWDDVDQFDAMACKTVLKNALSKFGILSIEMQRGIEADQSIQKEPGEYDYPDNAAVIPSISETVLDKGKAATMAYMQNCKNLKELMKCKADAQNYDLMDEFEEAVEYFKEQEKNTKDGK
jgi:recombination protein RecT